MLDEQGSRRQRSDGPPRSRQYDQDPGYPESRSQQSYSQGQEEGPSRASNGALPGRRGRGKGGRGESRAESRGGRGSGRGRGSAGEEWPELQVWAAVQGHGTCYMPQVTWRPDIVTGSGLQARCQWGKGCSVVIRPHARPLPVQLQLGATGTVRLYIASREM